MSAKLEAGNAIVVPEKLMFSTVMKDVKDITQNHDANCGHAWDILGNYLISRVTVQDQGEETREYMDKERRQPVTTDEVIDLGGYFAVLPGECSIPVPEKGVQTRFMKDVKDITQIMYQIAVTASVSLVAF